MADDTEENEKYFGELFDKIGRGKLETWLKELKDKETQTSQTISGATQPGGLEALLNSLLSEQKTENKTLKAKLETVMDLLTPEQRTLLRSPPGAVAGSSSQMQSGQNVPPPAKKKSWI